MTAQPESNQQAPQQAKRHNQQPTNTHALLANWGGLVGVVRNLKNSLVEPGPTTSSTSRDCAEVPPPIPKGTYDYGARPLGGCPVCCHPFLQFLVSKPGYQLYQLVAAPWQPLTWTVTSVIIGGGCLLQADV